MQNMIVLSETADNHGLVGVMLILFVVYAAYTAGSIILGRNRYIMLHKAKKLIEEGHKRKTEEECNL